MLRHLNNNNYIIRYMAHLSIVCRLTGSKDPPAAHLATSSSGTVLVVPSQAGIPPVIWLFSLTERRLTPNWGTDCRVGPQKASGALASAACATRRGFHSELSIPRRLGRWRYYWHYTRDHANRQLIIFYTDVAAS